LISHFNFLANENVEINNSSLNNSPNAANIYGIIKFTDLMSASIEMKKGIVAINNLDTPVDPVQFLTDSKKVLQHVNTVAKGMLGANISCLVDPCPLVLVIILVPFLSCKKY
jgi:hypothetical protein